MCTIITADRKTFDAHVADFIDRIQDDAKYNGHGFALILAGKRADEVSVLRALNVELAIAVLLGSDWERFWFHSRFATGSVRGLSGCHAFQARHRAVDWYVMHNGVLRHQEANHHAVDSEWIASLISRYGPDSALSTVSHNETFANCFVVAPTEGKWHMLRLNSGTLYTSKDGRSYSTNKVDGVIEKPVKENTWLVHEMNMAAAPLVTRGSVYGNTESEYGYRRHTAEVPAVPAPKTIPASDTSAAGPVASGSGMTTTSTDKTLGLLANMDNKSQLGREWIKTGRGVWVRQRGDVIFFNGREPNDRRKQRQGVH